MNRYDTPEWKELEDIQNRYFADTQDILSITGFMNHEQFIAHLNDYRNRVKNTQDILSTTGFMNHEQFIAHLSDYRNRVKTSK